MDNPVKNEKLIHNLDSSDASEKITIKSFIIFLVIASIAGLAVGFLFSLIKKATTVSQGTKSAKAEKTAGIADKKTFKDKAEGTLKEGGVDGEGNFHLERPGGKSQNVYLTSTTVDLSQYLGKKVRVWGETFQAEKAGWLMDVGLVEVL
ncbi:hypothetical protein HY357_03280 [Candidatus Roizmanbacteria bacterium]|nr:hypothetical protein [Candidatus Roizmanbacteria bacterium]